MREVGVHHVIKVVSCNLKTNKKAAGEMQSWVILLTGFITTNYTFQFTLCHIVNKNYVGLKKK